MRKDIQNCYRYKQSRHNKLFYINCDQITSTIGNNTAYRSMFYKHFVLFSHLHCLNGKMVLLCLLLNSANTVNYKKTILVGLVGRTRLKVELGNMVLQLNYCGIFEKCRHFAPIKLSINTSVDPSAVSY